MPSAKQVPTQREKIKDSKQVGKHAIQRLNMIEESQNLNPDKYFSIFNCPSLLYLVVTAAP